MKGDYKNSRAKCFYSTGAILTRCGSCLFNYIINVKFLLHGNKGKLKGKFIDIVYREK